MATPRNVAFHTLGCKLNFSETSSIKKLFENKGYGIVEFEEGADLYIINTCSVTEFADRKCRYEVRRALTYNPDAKVVIIGCYAQLKPKEIAEIPGVDLVLGASEKFNILEYIEDLSFYNNKGIIKSGDIREVNRFVGTFSIADRTRSFLKVQDGCDYKCSFCTIPLARGKSRSDTIESVLQNATNIIESGVKEIVLTGINLGDFGNGTEVIENKKPAKQGLFIDLIKALDTLHPDVRYRISSIEPNLLTDEIIRFVADSKCFLPHFHLPLQSGSNKILKAMRRRYRKEHYLDRVLHIKTLTPYAAIGCDVIAGFPGESNKDFNETYSFIRDLEISYLHVFTYSERANTLAAHFPNSVPVHERKERNKKLRILSEKMKRQFYEKHIGSKVNVLFEDNNKDGMILGFTENYIQCKTKYDPGLINQMVPALIREIDENGIACINIIKDTAHFLWNESKYFIHGDVHLK
ncbi:MAG TPA: tRNA (N(6)-L-threonylcarbamoyladenosine(37)-C(2))-methylthiotransferase MtaB [Saprospiraceae bacterium]|nr:tRNA (N(6)-L-threonylcarbamoyladenosine(37)-C(2))-methylthiotransferase MtaB [Saprospiraceae bacterium]